MTINVIQQTTAERKAETQQLFQEIQPYLDKGYSFRMALKKINKTEPINFKYGWFRELIEYAKTQGYDYNEYKWQRGKSD